MRIYFNRYETIFALIFLPDKVIIFVMDIYAQYSFTNAYIHSAQLNIYVQKCIKHGIFRKIFIFCQYSKKIH